MSSTAAGVDNPPAGSPSPAAAPRDRWRGRLVLLAPWMLVPLVVGLAYLVLPPASDMRSRYQAAAVALVAAPVLAWLLTRRTALAHHGAAALVATLLPGLTLISLHGTDWYFSGPFGDQSFRMEYATRFADDLSLQDYTYRDVPAFYSPGWFWVVGLVARTTGNPAWQTYKWVGIVSLYVAVVLAFLLWRRTCGTRLSALLVTVTTIGLPAADASWLGGETLLFSGAYEPYAWLVVLPLPALLTWLASAGGPFSWRRGWPSAPRWRWPPGCTCSTRWWRWSPSSSPSPGVGATAPGCSRQRSRPAPRWCSSPRGWGPSSSSGSRPARRRPWRRRT